jgi:NUMOD1 domain/GIY-YIG catalytic domain
MENNNNNRKSVVPIVSYLNIDANKSIIYKENRGKSGIYRLNNLITNKCYVGSSVSLSRRFNNYYSIAHLSNKDRSSIINNSILKYGYINFSLDILEYCEPRLCISREQHYIDILKPEYNICKTAGSPLGVKRDITFSINLSKAKRGKKYDIKVNNIKIIPIIMTPEAKLNMSLRAGGVSVKIFDKSNNLVNEFPTMLSAAKYLGVTHKTIRNRFNTGKSYDNFTYKFEIKDIRIWVYDSKHKIVNILVNKLKTSTYYNIPYTTLSSYIKSGKLYENKYYFCNMKSKYNQYFTKKK